MNRMDNFERQEIAVIAMSLQALIETTHHAKEVGLIPPDGLIETLESAFSKIQEVVDIRIAEEEAFESITSELSDVLLVAKLVEINPEIPTTEYNNESPRETE